MTNSVAGLLPVFAYFVTVVVSVPIAVISFALARRRLLEPVLAATLAAVTVLALLGIGTLAVLVSPSAGLAVLQTAAIAGAGFVALPLAIGTFVIRRVAGVDQDTALRRAVAGWPVALVLSVLVFVAPGGFLRYNLTFLTGTEFWLAFVAWAAVVLFGPALFGLLHYRLFS